MAAASCYGEGGIKTDHSGGRKSKCFSEINFLGNVLKINKQSYIKLNSFCAAKESVSKMKKQSVEWEKIFAHLYLVRDYYPK